MDYKEEDEEDKKYKGKKFTRKDFKKDVKEAVQEGVKKMPFQKKSLLVKGVPTPAGPRRSSARFSTRRKRRSLSSPGFPAGPYRGRRQR